MRIKVKVFPKAKKERVEKKDDILKVHVKDPASEGRANKRLIEILAKYLGVKKYKITIVKGGTSREKVINIDGSS